VDLARHNWSIVDGSSCYPRHHRPALAVALAGSRRDVFILASVSISIAEHRHSGPYRSRILDLSVPSSDASSSDASALVESEVARPDAAVRVNTEGLQVHSYGLSFIPASENTGDGRIYVVAVGVIVTNHNDFVVDLVASLYLQLAAGDTRWGAKALPLPLAILTGDSVEEADRALLGEQFVHVTDVQPHRTRAGHVVFELNYLMKRYIKLADLSHPMRMFLSFKDQNFGVRGEHMFIVQKGAHPILKRLLPDAVQAAFSPSDSERGS
jgi:hypothetical protein